MALNQLFDKMLALGPKWLLRLNETAGTTAADSSGNGIDFTASAAFTGTTGPFYTGKNDAATNKVWTAGTGSVRRNNADAKLNSTIANIPTTGITYVKWFKCAAGGPGTNTAIFDCRNSAGRNGFSIMVEENAGGAGSGTVSSVVLVDAAGGVSSFEFTDIAAFDSTSWSTDGLWHCMAIRIRRGDPAVPNEIVDVILDGITLVSTNASPLGAAGTFSDPGATQYMSTGLRYDGASDANGCVFGPEAWYNRLLSDEEIVAIYQAATYTIGDAAHGYCAVSINGGYHSEADQGTLKIDAATACAKGDYLGSWQNLTGGPNALNSAGNYTNPKFWVDPVGRAAVMFDGALQNNADGGAAPRPILTAATPGTASAARNGIFVCGVVSTANIVGAGSQRTIAQQRSDNSNRIDLRINQQVFMSIIATELTTPGTDFPVPRAMGGVPGVFGFVTGGAGTLTDAQIWNCGKTLGVTGNLAHGNYTRALDGNIILGTPDGSKGFFSGLMHACCVLGRTPHPIEVANLTAYWNHKWRADTADAHVLLTATSIESITIQNAVNGVTDLLGWQTYIPVAVQQRISLANPSIGGQQSGSIKRTDGSNHEVTNGGINLTDQHLEYGMWYSCGANNPNNDFDVIWVAEDYTNDIQRSHDDGAAGTTYMQSIANFNLNRSRVRTQAPRCKIVQVFGPNGAAWLTNDVNYLGVYNHMVAHTEINSAVVQMSGVSLWIHPNFVDGPVIGARVGAAVQALLPRRSGGGGSRRRGRLAFEKAR